MIKKILKNSERGQAIILIAAALVGLIAMIGLMTDGGILLIEYARLKRGIDAAAIAAAQQFRKDFTADDLENAAENFLMLNQSDVENVLIQTCDYPGTEHDTALCDAGGTRSKLVRVTASKRVTFGFMRVIGFNSTVVTATSVGEAAAIDLVLIMDTSLSMTYGTSGNPLTLDPGDDPAACNLIANGDAGACQPLDNIKTVARSFIQTLFFPYDRVAIVTMTEQTVGGSRNPTLIPFNDDLAEVDAALAGIKVFEPPLCVRDLNDGNQWISPSKGVCLEYDAVTGNFIGTNRPIWLGGDDLNESTPGDHDHNPTTLYSSNVGGTFIKANNAFLGEGAPKRDDAFWVVIALISGPANATGTNDLVNFPDGYCPVNTWNASATTDTPGCRDNDLLTPFQDDPLITRHSRGSPGNPLAIPPVLPVPADINYDADDYARDAADDLANPVTGNGVAIFTIGLGTAQGLTNQLRHSTVGLPTSGENLLIYAAEQAGDDPDHVPPNYTANHGQYYYAEDPLLDLGPIFLAIASNIFTRINQ